MRITGFFPALFLVLITFASNQVKSQEAINLSAVVCDSATGKALPFAQISLQTSAIGTVTNEEGRFILEVPALFSGDTLLVAYMGYETRKQLVSSLAGNTGRISLNPRSLLLSEVEIIALSPEEVLRKVIENIPGNYGRDSLILTAFVRSQKFVGGKLAEYTEAIIEDLKTGYQPYDRKDEREKSRQSNVPILLKGRVISDTLLVNSIGDLGKSAGCLGCNFVHDFAEFYYHTVLDEKQFRYYVFKMDELSKPGGGKIYHIRFDQKKGVKETLWKGEMFINGADFALLKVTQRPSFEAFDQFEKNKYKRRFTIGNTSGWYEEMPMMEWTTTYSKRGGEYYLNTISIENWLTFKNPATSRQVKFSHKNELVVTDATRDRQKIRNFKGDKSIGVNQRWDQVVGKGDAQFWKGFNYLPVEGKLEEGLVKMGGR